MTVQDKDTTDNGSVRYIKNAVLFGQEEGMDMSGSSQKVSKGYTLSFADNQVMMIKVRLYLLHNDKITSQP